MASSPPPLPIVGYTDRLSARPGDHIQVKISTTSKLPYHASLVSLLCADPNPDGPGVQEAPVPSAFEGEYPPVHQPLRGGSYGAACGIDAERIQCKEDGSFAAAATVWPTAPGGGGGLQTILACTDADGVAWRLAVDGDGLLCVDEAHRPPKKGGGAMRGRAWYRVFVSYDAKSGRVEWGQAAVSEMLRHEDKAWGFSAGKGLASPRGPAVGAACTVGVGAAVALDGGAPKELFNGKLEDPMLYSRPLSAAEASLDPRSRTLQPAIHWDFSLQIQSLTSFLDAGAWGYHGRLFNCPTRGMTGSRWSPDSEMCFRHAPQHYAAIHFHDDDLYDAQWRTSFTFRVPDDTASGCYGVVVETKEGGRDCMPFWVISSKGGKRKNKICVLISTFTYIVYGNHSRPDFDAQQWHARSSKWGAYPHNPAEHPELGLSTYNNHSDGSGICFASHLRPLLNIRPGYLTFGEGVGSGLRHMQADTHLNMWLVAMGLGYDVVTDYELHTEGVSCLEGYQIVSSGTHPEYHTSQTLDALQAYRDGGGNLCYLGGNGFYWRVAHCNALGLIEIRRGEGGIRAWSSESGEYYNVIDGAYGGLWRRSGRPPQRIGGVGFSAQGLFEGSYYRRSKEAAKRKDLQWVWEGVDGDILGNEGLSGGGAAGFELDRADESLGTPSGAVILASSEGHSDHFVLVPEEILTHVSNLAGEPDNKTLVRADILWWESPQKGGGTLFATGSITFCGSLPCSNFSNNVSRLLLNVFKHMLARD